MEEWDKQEDAMLKEQSINEVLKHTLPFFKRYQLRWLFYRRFNSYMFGKNDYTSDKRCSKCKKGCGGMKMGFMDMSDNGKFYMSCPHCSENLVEEPNANLNHLLYTYYRILMKVSEVILNYLHILRKKGETRYDIFGDERKYVSIYFRIEEDGAKVISTKLKRKWWEYIFIERTKFKIK